MPFRIRNLTLGTSLEKPRPRRRPFCQVTAASAMFAGLKQVFEEQQLLLPQGSDSERSGRRTRAVRATEPEERPSARRRRAEPPEDPPTSLELLAVGLVCFSHPDAPHRC